MSQMATQLLAADTLAETSKRQRGSRHERMLQKAHSSQKTDIYMKTESARVERVKEQAELMIVDQEGDEKEEEVVEKKAGLKRSSKNGNDDATKRQRKK